MAPLLCCHRGQPSGPPSRSLQGSLSHPLFWTPSRPSPTRRRSPAPSVGFCVVRRRCGQSFHPPDFAQGQVLRPAPSRISVRICASRRRCGQGRGSAPSLLPPDFAHCAGHRRCGQSRGSAPSLQLRPDFAQGESSPGPAGRVEDLHLATPPSGRRPGRRLCGFFSSKK